MAITFVNAASTENAASATYTTVMTWAQSAGDLIAVSIWTSGLTQVINSVTDTESNIYYQAYANQNAGNAAGGMQTIYVCANVAAAASSANTVTVKFAASQATATVCVGSWTSDNGFGYVDVLGTATTGHTTTASQSMTTVTANTLVIGFITTGTGGVTTVTSGTVAVTTATNKKSLVYTIKTSASATAHTATVSATNDWWVVGQVAIQKTAPVFTGTIPTMVQHASTAASAVSGGPYFINYPNPTLANNCLIAFVSAGFQTSQTLTVTDDQSHTWTKATGYPLSDGSNFTTHWVFYLANASAGVQKVTFTFGTQTYATFEILEYYNIATSSPEDGSGANNLLGNGPTLSSGSFTPGSSGDLILVYANDWNSNIPTASSYAAGPGFRPLTSYTNDQTTAKCLHYTIQATAAAINATCSLAGSTDLFVCFAVAFKAASAGTAPSSTAMRVVNRWTTLIDNSIGNAGILQFATKGNLFVAYTNFNTTQMNWTANASNLGNTWTHVAGTNTTAYGQMWYCANATPGDNLTMTPTVTANPFLTVQFYDIVNAATSPYDSTAGIPQQQITITTGTTLPVNESFSSATITPSVSNGIVFGFVENGAGPTTALLTPSGSFDADTYTGQTDADNLVNADGYSHYYNPNTSTLTWQWTFNSSSLPNTASFQAFAFKPGVTAINPTVATNPHFLFP
jgi:hypothetical protein